MEETLIKSKQFYKLKKSVKFELYGILNQNIRTKLKTTFRSKNNLTFLFDYSKILQHRENLRMTLHLKKNQVKANLLSKEIAQLTGITSLTLDLSYNKIGESGTSSVSNALTKLTGLTSLTLDLSSNNIGDSIKNELKKTFLDNLIIKV